MFIAARKIPALLELPDEPRAESFNFKPRILPVLKLSSAGLKRRWQGLKNYRLSVSLENGLKTKDQAEEIEKEPDYWQNIRQS